jgi:hypothetical protein
VLEPLVPQWRMQTLRVWRGSLCWSRIHSTHCSGDSFPVSANDTTGMANALYCRQRISLKLLVDSMRRPRRTLSAARVRRGWQNCRGSKTGCAPRRSPALKTANGPCSLIATAKLNNVEPYAWLRDVLQRMTEGHPASRLDELLPWNWQPISVKV